MRLARWRKRNHDDSGFALLTVIMSMFVLTMIVSAAMTYAVQTQVGSRQDQDSNGALTAARAGVDDFLSRLNTKDTYWTEYPGYSVNSVDFDCYNAAWQRPGIAGAPCTSVWGASPAVGWAAVPGSPAALYHYDLDLTDAATGGSVVITSTGKSRGVTRTVQSTLLRDGFTDFLYLSDYETVDPADESTYGINNPDAEANCHKHNWEGRSTDTNVCRDLPWVDGEIVDGAWHSNDTLLTWDSPTFKAPVTTSWTNCPVHPTVAQYPLCYRRDPARPGYPTFQQGIAWRAVQNFPTSIGSMRKYVDPTATNPGCLYSGPTRIKFTSNGKMQVWSKYSKGTLNPGCGIADASHLWSTGGQILDVPNNNVIYIQDVPSTQTSPSPIVTFCPGAGLPGYPNGAIGDNYPQYLDYNTYLQDYLCNKGTAWIEGVLKGRLTIAADNNIVITGDTTYAGGATGTDALGLIANNSIRAYHPVFCTEAEPAPKNTVCKTAVDLPRPNVATVGWSNPQIWAAMLALAHSWGVQSAPLGLGLGTIYVHGSIAQRFRGQVGSISGSGGGYNKGYSYDPRLETAPPPFFLNPLGAAWGAKTYGEVKRAY